VRYVPERFPVYAVFFPKFVKCILLERRLDTVEYVKGVVFLGPYFDERNGWMDGRT
jgi:hypothetical protein